MTNRKWDRHKALHLLISIVVAIGIWVYVDGIEQTLVDKTVSDIPIEFLGEDTTLAGRGLMLVSDESDATITLKLQGTREVISRLDPAKIRITADLSSITSTGEQSINYKIIYPLSGEFSNGITVKSASAYTVSVTIGELYSRSVDIRCDIQGTVADGYIAGELQFLPEKLEIRGQQAAVDAVSYAKVTLKIDNAQETVTQMLDYTLYGTNDQPVDTTMLHATADQIQVTMPVNVVKELPLKMNFIESPGSSLSNVDYTIEPASVTVSGDAALLKDVDSIILDDFDLTKLHDPTTYNYSIVLPDGCTNSSGVTRATLKIAFKDLASTTVTVTDISFENVPEGKTVTALTDALSVFLRGPSADIADVTDSDVSLVADLQDVGSASGSYTVPATVVVHTDGDVGPIDTYQIQVNISG